MDFFAHQRHYRRRSAWLVGLFVVAVGLVIAVVDAVVAGLYHLLSFLFADQGAQLPLTALAWLSALQLLVIALACAWRLLRLRAGGVSVALDLGATGIPASPERPIWRRLRDVVEEVAIASGVPVFNIFVLESEHGINAFAAGYTPSDAVICVTRGCLDKLTRDELQGVVAHELSHVVHGDMRLNMRLLGLLFGISGVGILGHQMLATSMDLSGGHRRAGVDASMQALLFLAGLVAVTYGAAGSVCARLVQAAVARTRESLADAAAVQYTRQVDGIAGALKKILALREGSRLGAVRRGEVAHMLLSGGGRAGGWFATHPPLRHRLHALGVRCSDAEIERLARAWQRPGRAADPLATGASVAGLAPLVDGAVGAAKSSAVAGSMAAARPVDARAGYPTRHEFDVAAMLRQRLPEHLLAAARDPARAAPLLLALLLERRDQAVLDRQRELIGRMLGVDMVQAVRAMRGPLRDLDAMARLPLAGLVFPALRRCPRPELVALLATLEALARADGHVSADEYCLLRLLGGQLRDLLDPAAGFRPGGKRLRSCRDPLAVLCAVMAMHGHGQDRMAAERAWRRALAHAVPGWSTAWAPPADWSKQLDAALRRLDRLRAPDKRLVSEALAVSISADGAVTVAEAELLRTICALLHCPLPPVRARLVPVAPLSETVRP